MKLTCIWFLLIFSVSSAVAQTAPTGTTLVASDNFTRANSSTTLGANWTASTGTWGITSDQAYHAATNPAQWAFAYYSGSSVGANPYATVKLVQNSNGNRTGAALVNSSNAGYFAYCSAGLETLNCTTILLVKTAGISTNAPSTLQTITGSWPMTTTYFSIYDNAGVLSVYANGTQIGTNTSDATYTPTRGGLISWQCIGPEYAYFEQGNKTAAIGGSVPRKRTVLTH